MTSGMFVYVKFKITKEAENPHWLFRSFVGTEKLLDGRIVKFKDETGNHQIKHPNYSNWFDIPKDLIEVVEPEIKNDIPLMTSREKDKCPKCGAIEVDAMTPATVYGCGSSDYDQRPGTFKQSDECKKKINNQ